MVSRMIWILITFTGFTSGYTPIECPSKELSTAQCGENQPCTGETFLCFGHLSVINPSIEKTFHCCDFSKTYCMETDMMSVPEIIHDPYHVMTHTRLQSKYYWYKTKLTINGETDDHFCPIPAAYQLSLFKYDLTKPVDFEIGKKTKKCKISQDCKDDEFCGHVLNKSKDHIYLKSRQDRTSVDRSNHGKSVQFCYKIPRGIIYTFNHTGYTIDRKAVGFTVCRDNSTCTGGSICITSDAIGDAKMRCITPEGKACKGNIYVGDGPVWPGLCLFPVSFVPSMLVFLPVALTVGIAMCFNKLV